jgi:hypothetical protein
MWMVPKCFNGMAEFSGLRVSDIKGALSKVRDPIFFALSLD